MASTGSFAEKFSVRCLCLKPFYRYYFCTVTKILLHSSYCFVNCVGVGASPIYRDTM